MVRKGERKGWMQRIIVLIHISLIHLKRIKRRRRGVRAGKEQKIVGMMLVRNQIKSDIMIIIVLKVISPMMIIMVLIKAQMLIIVL